MALRLAGEEYSVVQGLDGQGYLREIVAADDSPGLQVDQQGSGRLASFRLGGVEKAYVANDGLVGGTRLRVGELLLKEVAASELHIRDGNDTTLKHLVCSALYPSTIDFWYNSGARIDARDEDGSSITLRARDTGVGLVEVAKAVGAAEPHFHLTHPKVGSVAGLPTASADFRGFLYRVEGGVGVADALYICIKNATDTYEWHQIV
jgi:hypothetical protein